MARVRQQLQPEQRARDTRRLRGGHGRARGRDPDRRAGRAPGEPGERADAVAGVGGAVGAAHRRGIAARPGRLRGRPVPGCPRRRRTRRCRRTVRCRPTTARPPSSGVLGTSDAGFGAVGPLRRALEDRAGFIASVVVVSVPPTPAGPATANAARVTPSATVTAATTRGRDPSDGNTCSSARPGRVSPTLACRRLRRPECSVRARGYRRVAARFLNRAVGPRVRSGQREDEKRLRDVIRHHDHQRLPAPVGHEAVLTDEARPRS